MLSLKSAKVWTAVVHDTIPTTIKIGPLDSPDAQRSTTTVSLYTEEKARGDEG